MASLHLDIELGKMFRVFAFFIALLCPYAVSADADNPLGISIYGSFLHTEQVPNTLFFFSDIEENDSFELRKAIRSHDIDTVVLSSKGGSVWEGLNMAGIIFDKGLKTYVPQKGLGAEGNCASACSFMFFGGSTRVADGKLGVHQFYSGSAKDSAQIGKTQSNAQFTVSEIIGFLNEFETPPFVFERMFQQSDMYYFDDIEMDKITRLAKLLKEEDRSRIASFIDDFNVELALLREKENKQKPEPSPKKLKTMEITKHQLVKEIQVQLNRIGCNAGSVDGEIGHKTISAAMKFSSLSGLNFSEDMLHQIEFLELLKKTTKLNCESISDNILVSKQWADFDCVRERTDTVLITTTYSKKRVLNKNAYKFSGAFKTSEAKYTFSTLEESPIYPGKIQSTIFILNATFHDGSKRQYKLEGKTRLNSSGNYATFGVSSDQECRLRSGSEFFE